MGQQRDWRKKLAWGQPQVFKEADNGSYKIITIPENNAENFRFFIISLNPQNNDRTIKDKIRKVKAKIRVDLDQRERWLHVY